MRTMGDVRDDALRLLRTGIDHIIDRGDDRRGADFIRAAAHILGPSGTTSEGEPIFVAKGLHEALLALSREVVWPAVSKNASREAHDKMTDNL